MVLYSCCQCLRFARIVRFQSISAWRGRRLAHSPVQRAADRRAHGLLKLLHERVHNLADDQPGRFLGLFGDDAPQRHERGHEVHVGLHAFEHFRLEQHTVQVEALEGVLLHDLHH